MTIYIHEQDLPEHVTFDGDVAVDAEMMGLSTFRDRLCLVQLSDGKGDQHLVRIHQGQADAPRLKALLEDPKVTKIFHYARKDVVTMKVWLDISCAPLYCTKVASKLIRTYTDKHSYKTLVKELLNIDISKEEQLTNWGADTLTDAQKEYAAGDVLYLHQLRDRLNSMLARAGRMELAQACFDFLPVRAALDVAGWEDIDIFAHH